MASRNELKPVDRPNTYFHVYNRGVDRGLIFRDALDRKEFLQMFRRHLSAEKFVDSHNRPYRKLDSKVALIAFCLMPNHFHLILRQIEPGGMSALMRSTMIGYSQYFNQKYGREGPLFQGRYKAAPIIDRKHAQRVISYVHLNDSAIPAPDRFSSHLNYLGERYADWIDARLGLEIFGGSDRYAKYIAAAAAKS